jgi:hypothetical protein
MSELVAVLVAVEFLSACFSVRVNAEKFGIQITQEPACLLVYLASLLFCA